MRKTTLAVLFLQSLSGFGFGLANFFCSTPVWQFSVPSILYGVTCLVAFLRYRRGSRDTLWAFGLSFFLMLIAIGQLAMRTQPVSSAIGVATTSIFIAYVAVLVLMVKTLYPPSTSSKRWIRVIVILSLLVGVFAMLCLTALKRSSAYQETLQLVTTNAKITELLGSPVSPSFFVSGTIEESTSCVQVALQYRLRGPKATALINIEGEKHYTNWHFSLVSLKVEGETNTFRIKL